MRIGNGRTIEVKPASQHAADGGDQRPARRPEHGDVVAGDQPLRPEGRATARASSWTWRHETVTGVVGGHRRSDERDAVWRVGGEGEAVSRRRQMMAGSHSFAMTVLTLGAGNVDH